MTSMSSEPLIQNITGIQFSIMGPEEIENRSVVEITKHDTYEKNIPVIKGLFDPRMGVTDMGKTCKTCGQKNINCPGHFGHIKLSKPVYHYHFINTTVKILNCVCFRCSKILIDVDNHNSKEILKTPPNIRFTEIYNMSQKIKSCKSCNAEQPDKFKLIGLEGISKKINDSEEIIDIEYIKSVLERITDEDANFLGFSEKWCRPEWLICSTLPVPPPSVRPSVKQDNSQRMDDDLTHKLSDIVKTNNVLKKKIDSDSRKDIIDDWSKLLQYHVATLIDNDIPGLAQAAHRSGRALKSIRQRLKGKEGRIRNNLMGKRVDYSARSVITPDPNIELDELGVPLTISLDLTFPETVTKLNIKKLKKLIKNGPENHPGAKTIIKKEGNIKITIHDRNKNTIDLELGDIVNRHLIDGDYVLFNRQPSLHKMSMMGHRVRVMKGNTFRLNISVTPPYNADFDGDEMNMHAPQSTSSVAELKYIMSVTKQIISPRENKPIITIVQDTLLGINKLTSYSKIKYIVPKSDELLYINNNNIIPVKSIKNKKGKLDEITVDSSRFTKSQFMNIISNLSTFGNKLPKADLIYKLDDEDIELWSGKQVMSYILPYNLNLEMENDSVDDIKDITNFVKIFNGEVKQGTFDKSLFTKTSKGLIHTIYNDFGSERTKDFIDDLQKIVSYYLLVEGFSVGISDMIADKETNKELKNVIKQTKESITEITQELHLNIFENFSGQTNQDYFESKVNSILNKTTQITGKLGLANLDPKNRATTMINSGSKGKAINIAQMTACLGQQNVDGKRIPLGFDKRTLPHYTKDDDSSEARGFVENSFISGQTPQEYFFHAMGGREGLIDTAVKTSETGYVQRKLIKAMEDVKVNYDYSVRNSSGIIIQFIYGDDGMDACFVESQPLVVTKLNTEDMCKKFLFEKSFNWSNILEDDIIKILKKTKKYNKILEKNFMDILDHKYYLLELFKNTVESNIFYPVHLKRIVTNIVGLNNKNKSDISPIEIIERNEDLKNKLYIREEFKNNKIMHILIDIHLSPKILINDFRIIRTQYDELLETITKQFYKSRISPGEMVGAIAAQSIGEPATQMTLNTFHFAGVSAKSNVTRGIPRLRELLHITKNLKSPSIKIILKEKYENDRQVCNYIKNQLEYTTLRDIITESSIFFDPKNNKYETNIEEDKEFLDIYKEFLDMEYEDESEIIETNPWIIRLEFNRNIILNKGLTMEDVYLAINNYDSNNKIKFIYSDENSKVIIGRISIKQFKTSSEDKLMNGLYDQTDTISCFKDYEQDLLDNVIIKGIKNITNIVMSQESIDKQIDKEIVSTKRWILETDGTNLLDIFTSKYVDSFKTTSNDIIEIYETLGIEAARNKLIEEIRGVVEYEGSYINIRHIELLCDIMTSTGILLSINRQGINRGDSGPLAKCSFEDTTDQLIKSSLFGEMDKLLGVSSNIMMGQKIKAGTNNCELLFDENKYIEEISKLSDIPDDIETINQNIDEMFEDDKEEENYEYCNDDNFKFSIE
jgi:DNA-directed RNA polymerase II subunit RPB1